MKNVPVWGMKKIIHQLCVRLLLPIQPLQEQQQGNLSHHRGTAQRKCETGGLLLIERERSTLRDMDRTEIYDHRINYLTMITIINNYLGYYIICQE